MTEAEEPLSKESFGNNADLLVYPDRHESFGSLPPNAKLQIQFELTLENGVRASPGYLIDLESRALVHSWRDFSACRQLDGYGEKDLTSLIVGPDWPAGHWVVRLHCSAIIQYAPQANDEETGVATGTIPAQGPLPRQA